MWGLPEAKARTIKQCERIFPGLVLALQAIVYRKIGGQGPPRERSARGPLAWGEIDGIGQCISPCAGTGNFGDRLHGSWACTPYSLVMRVYWLNAHAPQPGPCCFAGNRLQILQSGRIYFNAMGID